MKANYTMDGQPALRVWLPIYVTRSVLTNAVILAGRSSSWDALAKASPRTLLRLVKHTVLKAGTDALWAVVAQPDESAYALFHVNRLLSAEETPLEPDPHPELQD